MWDRVSGSANPQIGFSEKYLLGVYSQGALSPIVSTEEAPPSSYTGFPKGYLFTYAFPLDRSTTSTCYMSADKKRITYENADFNLSKSEYVRSSEEFPKTLPPGY
jgi:hypothetical protein